MRYLPRIVLFGGLLPGILFGCAGRWDLPLVWAYVGVLISATVAVLLAIDPDLLRERVKPGPGGEDRNLRFLAMPFFLAHLVIAGLDVGRFHWSDTIPTWVRVGGLLGVAFAYSLTIWAMRVNRFFSPVVRIQTERGHRLVTSGPYAWVRHPGYAAALIMIGASGLALGSWWSLSANVPVVLLIFRRLLIEDRFLKQNLDGYRDYATRVRYRLMPGVW